MTRYLSTTCEKVVIVGENITLNWMINSTQVIEMPMSSTTVLFSITMTPGWPNNRPDLTMKRTTLYSAAMTPESMAHTKPHDPLHVYRMRELPLTQLPVDNTIDTLHSGHRTLTQTIITCRLKILSFGSSHLNRTFYNLTKHCVEISIGNRKCNYS